MDAEHRKTPGTPVSYGSKAMRGRATIWIPLFAPPAMSPWTRLGLDASSFAGVVVDTDTIRSENPGANRSI